jgi:hypothetical protein
LLCVFAMADTSQSTRERLRDMRAIMASDSSFDDGLWALAVAATIALGFAVGRTFPRPYIHRSVDWFFGCATCAAATIVLRNVAAKKGLSARRPVIIGALSAGAFAATGLFLDWSDWDLVSTTRWAWIGGISLGIAPIAGAICFGLGLQAALVDLLLELLSGGVDTFGEGFGYVVREGALTGFILVSLILTYEARTGKQLPWLL